MTESGLACKEETLLGAILAGAATGGGQPSFADRSRVGSARGTLSPGRSAQRAGAWLPDAQEKVVDLVYHT